MITAVIPAHNEAAALPGTLTALRDQDPAPDRILVISDKSTDDTVGIARRHGAEALATINNDHRKAGALNQALEHVNLDGFVLILDADTRLSRTFIARALREMEDPAVGGVGAVFGGERPTSYLELCQYLEWHRYREQVNRTGKTFIMSGTASLVRGRALRQVRIRTGQYYNTDTITEDMRLTLELKTSGWELRSPIECGAATEMMPTVRMLWLQRRRWYLGAMQNVADMGLTRVTARYWGQQVMLGLSVVLFWGLIILTITSLVTYGPSPPTLFWACIGAIFLVERVLSVWDQPVRLRLFAALIVPELIYALILQTAWAGAVVQRLTGSDGVWSHLNTTTNEEI
ncbi:glycosyltransferase family 2 protein [Nesterenkonia suensis]